MGEGVTISPTQGYHASLSTLLKFLLIKRFLLIGLQTFGNIATDLLRKFIYPHKDPERRFKKWI